MRYTARWNVSGAFNKLALVARCITMYRPRGTIPSKECNRRIMNSCLRKKLVSVSEEKLIVEVLTGVKKCISCNRWQITVTVLLLTVRFTIFTIPGKNEAICPRSLGIVFFCICPEKHVSGYPCRFRPILENLPLPSGFGISLTKIDRQEII